MVMLSSYPTPCNFERSVSHGRREGLDERPVSHERRKGLEEDTELGLTPDEDGVGSQERHAHPLHL